MMKHPNLLLITTDQQSATMLSCAGNPHLHTPNLDALAADGVRFEKAYAAQPLCIPQRCSWYSGLMPHEHGLTFNLPDQEMKPCLMMGRIFQDAGFRTGYSGKWHIMVDPEDSGRHGFEWTHNLISNGADEGIAPDLDRFLSEHDGRPFLFSASFNNPHNICGSARGGTSPDGNPGLPENIGQCPPVPDNFAVPEGEPSVVREIQRKYAEGIYPVAEWDEFRWRLHRWFYCRMVEIVDRRIGEVMQHLHRHGVAEDTLIVFASDHGDGNAHHQWNQKQTLYDESARVPFLISRPGGNGGRVESRALVNTGLDLIPTLCGLGGVEVPSRLQGVDWSSLLNSEHLPVERDHVIIETEMGTYGSSDGVLGRAVRTDRWKYMLYNRGEPREFLGDLEKDPGETRNCASDPDCREVLAQHREHLRALIRNTGDVFPLDAVPAS